MVLLSSIPVTIVTLDVVNLRFCFLDFRTKMALLLLHSLWHVLSAYTGYVVGMLHADVHSCHGHGHDYE
jgi:hypothetical protein